MRKFIYLPIEIKVRELNSKLLLAVKLADLGNSVIVCNRIFVNKLKKKPIGVVLAKSIAGFEIENIKKHKKHGNLFASLDIEGILNISSKQQSFRFSQDTIDEVDMIFLNGEKELMNIKENNFRLDENKIRLIGAPQFDFYKKPLSNYFKEKSTVYKSHYGKYILVLSRFGEVNNKFKKEDQSWEHYYNKNLNLNISCELLNKISGFEQHSKKIFKSFIEMLPILSNEFPDFTIVVRPHPNEKIETWLEFTKHLKNIKVIFEGEVGHWIEGSEFVIHNGCTTAIESYLLNKPIISYMPYSSEEFDLHIANMTGKKCINLDELISVSKLILEKNYEIINIDKELKKYIYNVDVNACELLAKELTILSHRIENSKKNEFNVNYFLTKLRLIVEKIRLRNSRELVKFPYTNLYEVNERLLKICKNLQIDFKAYRVKEIGFNSFIIYKKS
jgi:surface carbohydrate biosynthesis protein